MKLMMIKGSIIQKPSLIREDLRKTNLMERGKKRDRTMSLMDNMKMIKEDKAL